jgi:DNA-binding transcriptional ArsR family regulator
LQYQASLLTHVKALIVDALPGFQINATMDMIADRLAKDGKGFLQDALNIALDDAHQYIFYPGIYKTNTLSAMGSEAYADITMVFGLHIFDLVKTLDRLENTGEKAEAFLKCLADSTKVGMLKLLKDGPMYGSQLAEKLNCTGANISHHMSAMLSLGIVHLEKENNRVYLHLDKEAIGHLFDDAKGLFL